MSTMNIHTGLHPVPTGKGFYRHTSQMPHGLESNPADEDSEDKPDSSVPSAGHITA